MINIRYIYVLYSISCACIIERPVLSVLGVDGLFSIAVAHTGPSAVMCVLCVVVCYCYIAVCVMGREHHHCVWRDGGEGGG